MRYSSPTGSPISSRSIPTGAHRFRSSGSGSMTATSSAPTCSSSRSCGTSGATRACRFRSRRRSRMRWVCGNTSSIHGRATIEEGGAAELLQELARTYLGPDVVFPPMPDPPPGFRLRIARRADRRRLAPGRSALGLEAPARGSRAAKTRRDGCAAAIAVDGCRARACVLPCGFWDRVGARRWIRLPRAAVLQVNGLDADNAPSRDHFGRGVGHGDGYDGGRPDDDRSVAGAPGTVPRRRRKRSERAARAIAGTVAVDYGRWDGDLRVADRRCRANLRREHHHRSIPLSGE